MVVAGVEKLGESRVAGSLFDIFAPALFLFLRTLCDFAPVLFFLPLALFFFLCALCGFSPALFFFV
jgi:hypothetical protein